MIPINKKWILVLAIIVVGAAAIINQQRVTSQCCQSSLEKLFAPQNAPVQTVIPAQQAVPVVIQQPVAVSRPVTVTRSYAPVQQFSAPVASTSFYPNSSCTCNSTPVTRTVTKLVPQTEYREEEVTTYETVYEEETRYRTKTVSRQVPETTVKTETVTVSRPVWETIEKETYSDKVSYVPETSEREEIQNVTVPVTELQERKIVEKVRKPVQTTVMKQRSVTVNKEVTSVRTELQDQGRYVTNYTPVPNRTYSRLAWFPGGDYYNPATGSTKYRLPGFYWTQMTPAPQYQANRIWQSNLVEKQVPVTTIIPETVTENYPVCETSYQDEEIVRTEQVPVTTYKQEQIVKKIPVTTYKPITERIVQKIPVQVCKIQKEEQIREIPVTTYKTVCEVIKEPYTVKVAKTVPKTVKVKRPYTVYKKVTETISDAPVSSPCAIHSPCEVDSLSLSATVNHSSSSTPATSVNPSTTAAKPSADQGSNPVPAVPGTNSTKVDAGSVQPSLNKESTDMESVRTANRPVSPLASEIKPTAPVRLSTEDTDAVKQGIDSSEKKTTEPSKPDAIKKKSEQTKTFEPDPQEKTVTTPPKGAVNPIFHSAPLPVNSSGSSDLRSSAPTLTGATPTTIAPDFSKSDSGNAAPIKKGNAENGQDQASNIKEVSANDQKAVMVQKPAADQAVTPANHEEIKGSSAPIATAELDSASNDKSKIAPAQFELDQKGTPAAAAPPTIAPTHILSND